MSSLKVTNPATGKRIAEFPIDDVTSVTAKIEAASKAQVEWAKRSFGDRAKILESFGSLLSDNLESSALILSNEVGKPVGQAKGEIKGVQARLKFFLENAESVLGTRQARKEDKMDEQVRWEPLGTIGNISAWNYPYFVGCNVFIPGLITGNSIVYKPSEYATMTGLNIASLLHKAGVPKDVFAPVIGNGPDVGNAIVENPKIKGLFFTGSLKTGQLIYKNLANRFTRVQLELGGKDPMYVCEDADPEASAKGLADGAMYNTGQSCCSVERIYVHEKIYDKFVQAFVAEVKTFRMGDPSATDTYIGALTLATQPGVLLDQVNDAVSKGAKVLVGGKIPANKPGNWFEPTVLVNVDHTMKVMKDESFGPIIGIQKVSSDEEAIKLMNDSYYGLTAGVYTPNRDRAEKLLPKIESGTVYWNACDRVSPYLPWSGRKGSGIGATLGLEGIQAFVQPKAYHFIGK